MTIGILGGGQLGRMLALAGIPLGIKCRILDPTPRAPAAVAAEQIVGEFDDHAALADFVRGLDAVTYEFENVPVAAARWLAERTPVYPNPQALEIAQDRLAERTFFREVGIPGSRFAAVETQKEFAKAIESIQLPAVLKTRRFGYDGKGQQVIRDANDAEAAWTRLGGRPLILEQFIPFDREVSQLAVRSQGGVVQFYPLVENTHRDGILVKSIAPADDNFAGRLAQQYVEKAMIALDYVGVLAMEFFQVGQQILVNEMAPRVHNSGHWTIEGAATSQFANHLRAVAGWPLGICDSYGPAAMVNLIGSLPDAEAVLRVPGASLHLYGKAPRPGRKLGHITITAGDRTTLHDRIRQLEQLAPM